jgi:hypothetical protein
LGGPALGLAETHLDGESDRPRSKMLGHDGSPSPTLIAFRSQSPP